MTRGRRHLDLFLDDGGVMNENQRRSGQWQRLVGRFLAPRLGGATEAWARANLEVAPALFRRYESHFEANPQANWWTFWDDYATDWLSGMCRHVGVAPPSNPDDQRRLARTCAEFVTRRVRSAQPGAVGAIRRLAASGHVLRTASGEASWELDGYLTGMRVRPLFVDLYGPDRVDRAKASPTYYERVFASAGVSPSDALVIDDSERALDWAAEVGARTILCRLEPPGASRHRHVRRLADVPRSLL